MSNQKGNQYPLWGINNAFQVFALNTDGSTKTMSKEDFAMNIAVSEDGTVWVLSTEPDPDGGGAKIYWSNGDDTWNEIDTPEEGGLSVSSGPGSSCYYLDANNAIRQLQTDGTATTIYNSNIVLEMDYGGGYVWALLIDNSNGKVGLYYAKSGSTLNFVKFEGDYQPHGISVDYAGNCNAADNFDPVYFSNDGKSTGSSGSGANGKTLFVSSKNWTYLLSTDYTSDYQNVIMEWQDTSGGTFVATSAGGIRIAATFYTRS